MRRRSATATKIGALAFVTLLCWPEARARASRIHIRARTSAESYAVAIPGLAGEFFTRRRLVQRLDLGAHDLLAPRDPQAVDRDPAHGQLRIVSSLRIRHDFGTFTRNIDSPSGHLIAQSDERQFDLLFGYLEGERLGGHVDLRIGRQFDAQGLDWFVFDGVWTRIRTPAHLAFETFAGLRVLGSSALGYPSMELDGTRPAEHPAHTAPVAGVAVSLIDLPWLQARVGYRRSTSTLGDSVDYANEALAQALAAEDRWWGSSVDEEVLTASASLDLWQGRVSADVAARYDMAHARVDDFSVGLQWRPAKPHMLRLQYLRAHPVFDLDSIFAVFRSDPFEEVRLHHQVDLGEFWQLGVRARIRLASGDQPRDTRERASGGGGASALYRDARTSIWMDVFTLTDATATRWGSRTRLRQLIAGDRWALDFGLLGAGIRRDPNEFPSWTSASGFELSARAAVDLRLWRGVHLDVSAEQLMSDAIRRSFRVMAVLAADWNFRVGVR